MGNEKQRYFIEIAFHGANYHGWQVQDNAITVQELIDTALQTVFRQKIKTIGCGRTDTGVHAKQLFAHFDCLSFEITEKRHQLLKGLNAILPKDIAIKNIFQVPDHFHARFDAVSRSYKYYIHFEKDPFLEGLSWHVRDKPDIIKMNKAAMLMMKYHDFSCFSKTHTQVLTNNCEIYHAEWKWLEGERLVFSITANRFLRNMVRAIVGTLIEIGTNKNTVESIHSTIQSKNRSIAGASVPACGLYLTEVRYPDFNNNNDI